MSRKTAMAKTIGYIIGSGMILLGALGLFNAYSDAGKPPVVRTDLTTTGVITNLEIMETRHKIGVTLVTEYSMKYKFVDEAGNTHYDTETLEPYEFAVLHEGKEIQIRYHSNNPWISASPYGHYMGVDHPALAPQSMSQKLMICIGLMLFGLLIIVCLKFVAKDETTNITFNERELATAGR